MVWRKLGTKLLYSTSSHPQTDGQMEATNRTLGSLLRTTLAVNKENWVECLPFIEFAYNRAIHSATKMSPFEVAYGFQPFTPLDLLPLPTDRLDSPNGAAKVQFVKELHAQVRANIEKRTEDYARYANRGRKPMLFQPGDWVWVHMRPERFPLKRTSKLNPRGMGPFQVISKVNDNAYKLDMPGETQLPTTFNVIDLVPFDVGDENGVLRTKPTQGGGNEKNQGRGPDETLDEDTDTTTDMTNGPPLPRVQPSATTRSKSSTRNLRFKFNAYVQWLMKDPQDSTPDDSKTKFNDQASLRTVFTIILGEDH